MDSSTNRVLYDDEFSYIGYHGCRSLGHLRLFDPGPDKPYTVIVTELDTNPGTSVTNAAEKLAASVWQFLERPARGMTWIEHYRDRAFIAKRPQFKEHFDLVSFNQVGSTFRHPRWRRISKDEAQALCGTFL
jgi:hypothetical protein